MPGFICITMYWKVWLSFLASISSQMSLTVSSSFVLVVLFEVLHFILRFHVICFDHCDWPHYILPSYVLFGCSLICVFSIEYNTVCNSSFTVFKFGLSRFAIISVWTSRLLTSFLFSYVSSQPGHDSQIMHHFSANTVVLQLKDIPVFN